MILIKASFSCNKNNLRSFCCCNFYSKSTKNNTIFFGIWYFNKKSLRGQPFFLFFPVLEISRKSSLGNVNLCETLWVLCLHWIPVFYSLFFLSSISRHQTPTYSNPYSRSINAMHFRKTAFLHNSLVHWLKRAVSG